MKQVLHPKFVTTVLVIVISFGLILSNAWADDDDDRRCKKSNLNGRYVFSQSGQIAAGFGVNTPVAIAGYAKVNKNGSFIGSETVSIGASTTAQPEMSENLFCDGSWKIVDTQNCIVDFEWEEKVMIEPGQNCETAFSVGVRTAKAYIAPSLKKGYFISTINDGIVVVGPWTR